MYGTSEHKAETGIVHAEKDEDPSGDKHREELIIGAQETLSEGRSPWRVLFENKKIFLLILAVQSNAIIVGIEFSMPGNLLGIDSFLKVMGKQSSDGSYAIPANILTIWSALFSTFQVVGQFVGGWQSDYFGRRICIYSVFFWIYIGVMLEIISHDWKMWLGSKIVIGFGTGIMQSVVPTYVSEVSPREVRAIYLSLFNMCMNIGALFATLVPYGTNLRWPNISDERSFRVPLYVGIAMPTISLIAALFIVVESPWWLLMRARRDEARKNLDYIHSWQKNYDGDAAFAQLEYTLEKEAEQAEISRQSSYLDCFRGVDARRTFCAVFPALSQNLAGQNLAGTYATYFFELAGSTQPLVNSIITTAVALGCNFISFFLIESKRIGRWGLLQGGVVVMTLCMLAIALIAVIANGTYDYAASTCLTLFIALFVAASTFGPGVAGWAYTGESGSSRLRAKTATLGTVGNATVGLVMTSVLPYMLDDVDQGGRGWGAKTGFMFFILGSISSALIYFFIPEYAGRSYAQLDELFLRRVPARKFAKTECTGEYGRDLVD